MKKLLFATAMATGFGMAMSANAGELGGAVGGVGGAVGGVSGAVGGSVTAGTSANASGGNIGDVGNVTSNVAHFGVGASTTASANAAISADTRNEIRQISALDSVGSIALVDVSTVTNADANASLNNDPSQNPSSAAKIQAALASNANVMMAIMAENPDFDIESVVAADVRANGELVIFTN